MRRKAARFKAAVRSKTRADVANALMCCVVVFGAVALMLVICTVLSGSALPECDTGEDAAATPTLEHLGRYTVTAYCACPACCGKAYGDPAYGVTATGTRATEGRTIAVDPSVIPYGTVVYIDGASYVAEDCGGFTGRHIDIYMDDHAEALAWGLRECEVCVMGEG